MASISARRRRRFMVGSSSSLTIRACMFLRQRVLCESTTPHSVGFSSGLMASLNCWCVA